MKDNFCESCVEEENTKRDLEEQVAKDKLSNKKVSTSSNKRKMPHRYQMKEIVRNQNQTQDQNLHVLKIQTIRKMKL